MKYPITAQRLREALNNKKTLKYKDIVTISVSISKF